MVERQDPDNFTCFSMQEWCEWKIASHVFKVKAYSVKHFIILASKFDRFKALTFWHNIILAVLQFNALLKLFFILIGATLKGKNMLPKSSPF